MQHRLAGPGIDHKLHLVEDRLVPVLGVEHLLVGGGLVSSRGLFASAARALAIVRNVFVQLALRDRKRLGSLVSAVWPQTTWASQALPARARQENNNTVERFMLILLGAM